jgi:hypothetical protein
MIFLCLFVAAMPVKADSQQAVTAPEWDAFFENQNGWLGADCDASLPLPQTGKINDDNRKTLWLFDDTVIGKIQGGKRVDSRMTHSSIAIQSGVNPASASKEFFLGKENGNLQCGFIGPPDHKGWFWFGGSFTAGKSIYFFLEQTAPNGEGGAFGFQMTALWVARVPNPMDSPVNWRIQYTQLPFFKTGKDGSTFFGHAAFRQGNQVYIYGTNEQRYPFSVKRSLMLARVSLSKISDPAQWRFYSDGKWQKDWRSASALCGEDIGAEFSVNKIAGIDKYLLVYSPSDLTPEIRVRTAPSPAGPWSAAAAVYTCPEGKEKNVFCYAARAHPELSDKDNLLISYATNSTDFSQLFSNPSLYFPRFVWLKLSGLQSSPAK